MSRKDVGSNKPPDKKEPFTERTNARGTFDLSFPWIGGSVSVNWPATGRQAMMEIASVCVVILVVLPLVAYIIFVGAVPENIEQFSQMMSTRRRDGKDEQQKMRPPEKIQVRTNDGIEIVEGCLPCPDLDCEHDCPCPPCSLCPECLPAPEAFLPPAKKTMAPPPESALKTGPQLFE